MSIQPIKSSFEISTPPLEVDLSREVEITKFFMQALEQMQKTETAQAQQNTTLSVEIIECEGRIKENQILFDGEMAALEEKKNALEKAIEDMRSELNLSLAQIDEKIETVKKEEEEVIKILRQIKEEAIASLKTVNDAEKKAAEQAVSAEVVKVQALWSEKILKEKMRFESAINRCLSG